jgi:hypothetical protein
MWVNACRNGKPESMHARMWGGLLQNTVSPMGDMVHFFVCTCNHWCSDSFLTQQALHPYNISKLSLSDSQLIDGTISRLRSKVKVMLWWKKDVNETLIFSSFYQINSKLGVKVANGLPLSWLFFGANQPWPSWVSLRVEICLPQGQIFR